MPPNTKQKIAVLDITANTKAEIEAKLLLGWVIQDVTNLQPLFDKILVVYATPPEP